MRWILFMKKKDVAKKKEKELIHIGIAPLSIKVSESRKSKSGLEKKTLLLFLSTTAFSNWRGKPSSAKHKLHPNGFCLYLIPRKKSQTKSRLMSSVLSTLYVLYTLNKSFTFYKWGEGSGLGRLLACLLCRMASSLVMKTSSSRKLQWPFKKQGGRKDEKRKESLVTNSLKFELNVELKSFLSENSVLFSCTYNLTKFSSIFPHSAEV